MNGLNIAIQSVGVVLVVIAIAMVIKPETLRRVIALFKKGSLIYLAGVVRTVLAVVFLMGCSSSREPRIIAFIGILFLLSAIVVFLMGPKKVGPMLGWYEKQPPFILRAVCMLIIGIGLLIVYSA